MLTGGGGNSLLLRRRMMMQGMGNISPYPDPWVDDGKVWCYYNVTTTESDTTILNNTYAGFASTMEVDGVSVPLSNKHRFSTLGEHLVKYGLTDPTSISGNNGGRFRQVNALKRVYLPNGITKIPGLTFYGAPRDGYILTHVVIPESVQIWGDSGQSVFYEAPSVKNSISLPNLTTCYSTFGRAFTEITIGNLVASLPTGVFRECNRLIKVDIGSGISSIGQLSFYECGSLKTITIRAINPPSLDSQAWRKNYALTAIYVPAESVDLYKAAANWSEKASIIQAIP